jgi:hypothetical protein
LAGAALYAIGRDIRHVLTKEARSLPGSALVSPRPDVV